MLRFLTAGESHGPAEISILEGIPAGLPLELSDVQKELDKRKSGAGRGGRGLIETDRAEILSGVRHGKTIGSPIAITVRNLDYRNWKNKVIPEVSNPRPGHADLAGLIKYGFGDARNVLERASARETVMRVAVGAVCKKLLSEFGIKIASHTVAIGKVKLTNKDYALGDIEKVYKDDPVIRCIDKKFSRLMEVEILEATGHKETLGGIIEIVAVNVPVGLGSYVQWDRKLDGLISQALMSIPSVKAVEIGEGVENASKPGSLVQDEINFKNRKFFRTANRAGGLEGGVTNGENILCRIFLKPISTLGKPLRTVNLRSKKTVPALIERSDICVVPRAGVIAESMLAFVLAREFLIKFGHDSLSDIKTALEGYRQRLPTI